MRSKYCSAKFAQSKHKQLTILPGSQKIDLAEVVLAMLLGADSLRKAKRVKMVGFQGLKISIRRKAMKKMSLSFADKIKANLRQKLASRI